MQNITIKDLMTRSFKTIRLDDTLKIAAAVMRQTGIDDLPVVNNEGDLIGIMTKASLLDAIASGKSHDTRVKNLLKKGVVIVREHQTYEETAEDIRSGRVLGSTIVLDASGDISGIVTETSFLSAMLGKEAFFSTQMSAILHAMHNGIITINAEGIITSLNRAAEKMFPLPDATPVDKHIGAVLPGLELDRVMVLGLPSVGVKYRESERSLVCNISPIESENNIRITPAIGYAI